MKKLLIICCIITTILILPILVIDYYIKNEFLKIFFNSQAIPLLGTILALNMALGASLQAILINIEVQHQKENLFISTRREIKENILFMIITFLLLFILQVSTPILNKSNFFLVTFLTGIKLLLFFLYLYAVKEMGEAVFHISNKKIINNTK